MNLPWIQYGRDFGSSDGISRGANRARLREDLSELSSRGLRIVRWFVFSDGREGLTLGSRGRVAGLSDGFLEDFRVSLEEALANSVALMPCLLDFLWFADKPFPSLTPLIEAP
ncbi:MAG: hypothetical protein HYU64_14420, partial [Armatimonadetes bacterium]|nr:hypothetical protein [Armatimonadota bacterium]